MRLVIGHDHTGVRTFDMAAAKRFWCDMLGLVAIPEKDNWLGFDDGRQFLHLMPAGNVDNPSKASQENEVDLADHVALEVSSLEDVVARLLDHGMKPFQSAVNAKDRVEITDKEQALEFGIGTVYVFDPSGNLVEFVERSRGIFAQLRGEGAIS